MLSPRAVLRLWFRFEDRVGRREYILSGLALAVIKYLLTAAISWGDSPSKLSVIDYLSMVRVLWVEGHPPATTGMMLAYAALTLPFVWIGVSLTMRRAIDANRSPWLAMLFFVPIFNYLVLAMLSVLPTRAPDRPTTTVIVKGERVPRGLAAAGAGAA